MIDNLETVTSALAHSERLAALHNTGLLDSPVDPAFDRFTRLATRILHVPIAMISLLDKNRQFIKSCIGLPEPLATERSVAPSAAFCQYVVSSAAPLAIEDARIHPTLFDIPAVTVFKVVAYAAMPLITAEGYCLGTLCVMTYEPRQWMDEEMAILEDLAALVITEIELRAQSFARKQVEESLAQEHTLLRTLIDNLPDFIYAKDRESRFILNNLAHARSLSDALPDEIVGKNDYDFFPYEMARRFFDDDQQVVRTGKALLQREESTLSITREVIWGSTTKAPLRDRDGNIIGIVGLTRDITDHKQAVEALHDSEERYRIISELISDYAYSFRIRPDGTLYHEWVTDSFKRVTGYTQAEIDSQGDYALFHPDDRALVAADLERMLLGETFSREYRIITKSGELRWIYLHRRPVWDEDEGRVVRFFGVAQDITDRKQAEELLRESEGRYRTLFVAAERQARELALLDQVRTVLARELDQDLIFHNVVEAIAETFGYTQVSLYLLEGETLVLQHQVGYDRVITHVPISKGVSGRVARSAQPILIEDARSDPDFLGAIDDIASEVCVPLFDQGILVGVLNVESTTGMSLTDADLRLMVALSSQVGMAIGRARLHGQVSASEQRFRAMSDASPLGIFLTDANGDCLYTNTVYQRICGLTMDETLGHGWNRALHPDDYDRVVGAWYEASQNRIPFEAVCRFLHRDNSVVWASVKAVAVQSGAPLSGYVGIVEDITERRQSEEELRESQERFRQVTETIQQAFWLRDPHENRFIYISPAAEAVWGISSERLLQHPQLFAETLHPDDRERVLRSQSNQRKGEHSPEIEYRIMRPDGSIRWVWSRAFTILDDDGSVARIVGLSEDITERKDSASQVLELVIEREKIRVLAEFLRNAAHDLRTPLATMNMSLYLLRKAVELKDVHKQLRHITTLEEQTNHIHNLIEDLFILARLDIGSADFRFEPYDLNDLLREVCDSQEEMVADKHHKLTLDLDKNLPEIAIDRLYLKRALSHMFINALNYTPDGGVVSVETRLSDNEVLITIRDNGLGISDDELPHIFERFFRADRARSTDTGGSGLGLTIAKKIIDAHSGSIEVTSAPGEGSAFTIVLPLLINAN
ncbi:MAG: PAS domain S-box protein [Burkholderiales bacterium]|nr:PAS domain S-box protein [Anaerolineae bacterium]